MNASVAYRWRNAEMLVLVPLYGNRVADAVLSRRARKPVVCNSMRRSVPAGIPVLRRAVA